jgi:uncharacterized protein (TIGR00266 family)
MNFTIEHRPEFSWLTVQVPTGEKLFVEASSMASMSTNMKMTAKFRGGLKRFFTSESLFLSEFTAEQTTGEVSIAPGPFGDIGHFSLNNQTVFLSSNAYVAHTSGVEYDTKFQNFAKGLLSGAGWFLAKMSGTGDVWYNGYGAIIEMPVEDSLLIDNGHLVAFTEGLQYEMVKIGGYKSLFFSGEGFVCKFSGVGKVYVQTKKPSALVGWANQFRVVQSSNN